MASSTDEEFKEKLLWNVKREVSVTFHSSRLIICLTINMEDATHAKSAVRCSIILLID